MINILLGVLLAQTPGPPKCPSDYERSVYRVSDCQGSKKSSAFYVTWEGKKKVITALHAVSKCSLEQAVILETGLESGDGAKLFAKLEAVDLEHDLALLDPFPGDWNGRPLFERAPSASATVSNGTIMGYPLDSKVLSIMDVSFLNRGKPLSLVEYFGGFWGRNMAEVPNPSTKVLGLANAVQPGESGGPVVDRDCKLLGVVDGGWLISARRPGTGQNETRVGVARSYAIPLDKEIKFHGGEKGKADLAEARNKLKTVPIPPHASSEADGIPIPKGPPGLLLMRSEVTQQDFLDVCGKGSPDLCQKSGRILPGRQNYPVTDLSPETAKLVCQRLFPSRQGHIPTWPEWLSVAESLQGRPLTPYNLSTSQSQIEALDPGVEDEAGFVNFFGNVYEVVARPDGKYGYVGGSYATSPEKLWPGTGQVNAVGATHSWTTQVRGAEVGLRCAFSAAASPPPAVPATMTEAEARKAARGRENTYAKAGHLEVSALFGSAVATNARPTAFHSQVELAAGFANRWTAFTSLMRVPEFTVGEETRQFEAFQGGTQRQIGFGRIGAANFFPYVLSGVGRHSQRSSLPSGTGSQNISTKVTFVAIGGAGVRVFTQATGRWGLRFDYRVMLPIERLSSYWVHHVLSGGIAIQVGR